jgi:hypothetical protein
LSRQLGVNSGKRIRELVGPKFKQFDKEDGMKRLLLLLAVVVFVSAAYAQQNSVGTVGSRPRVFISDSQSWELGGAVGGTGDGFGGAARGGARPQTAEIIKTFSERCPRVIANDRRDKADYVILLDHEGGKEIFLRDNKVVVFNKDGDSILSHSTRTLGNAVKDACDAIMKDWPARRTAEAAGTRFQDGGSARPVTSAK